MASAAAHACAVQYWMLLASMAVHCGIYWPRWHCSLALFAMLSEAHGLVEVFLLANSSSSSSSSNQASIAANNGAVQQQLSLVADNNPLAEIYQ